MKKYLFSIAMLLLATTVNAQNAPKNVSLEVHEFEYVKPKAGNVALSILTSVATEKIYTFDKSIVPMINQAIVSGASNINWVNRQNSSNNEADYSLVGTVEKSEKYSGEKDSGVNICFRASIVDNKTGEEVASKYISTGSWSYCSTEDMASLKAEACRYVARNVTEFIFEAMPVMGEVLEKGVEQANGKVKNSQCYVNLGEIHDVFKGLKLYIVENGKYKAALTVDEVMGADLCSCKISSGQSYISKCIKSGSSLNVTSKPKKI